MIRIVRWGRRCVAGVAATTTIAGVALFGAQSATAATSSSGSPAHAVGNYLDATLGGRPIDAIAKLAYADARDPGSTSTQNPLDVTLFKSLDLPLSGALQLPGSGDTIHLGAVTQKAQAKLHGKSFGQAGTALNQGGVSIGGRDSSDEAGEATIKLSPDALGGGALTLPGAGSLPALGEVDLKVGALSAVAQAPKITGYNIADLGLTVQSPALGALLKTLGGALDPTGVSSQLTSLLGTTIPLPPTCNLGKVLLPQSLNLEGGAIKISATNGSLTIDLKALLDELGLNLNALPANTDVLAYLLSYLADPAGLATGIENVIDGLVNPLENDFKSCMNVLPGAGTALDPLQAAVTNGQKQLTDAVNGLLGSLAGGTGNPLKPLSDALGKLIDIGANVQENGPAGPPQAPFVSGLDATAKQGTPIESGTTLVRALEINIAAGAGSQLTSPSLPGLSALPGAPGLSGVGQGFFSAASGNAGILTVGLANASVRQGVAAAAPPAATATPAGPAALTPAAEPLPTAVAAGEGTHGTPVTPLILLALGMGMAGAAGIAWKVRGRHA